MTTSPDDMDPYHKWLGIPKHQQPPTFYRLLGIEPFEHNPEVIDAAASRQVAYLHQLTSGPHRRLTQRLMNEIAQARRVLMDEISRDKYDSKLRACSPGDADPDAVESPTPSAGKTFPAFDFGKKSSGTERKPDIALKPVMDDVDRSVASQEPQAASDPPDPPATGSRRGIAWWQRNDWRIHVGISAVTVTIFIVYLLFWGPGSQRRYQPKGDFKQPEIQSFDDKFK